MRGFLLKISAIFLLVPSFSLHYAFELPSNETFSKWNTLLEIRLSDLVAAVTQIEFANSVYKSNPDFTLEKVNGEEVLKSVLKKLSKLLQSKKTALKNLVDKAEEKFIKFQKANKTMLTLDNVSFINMKALKPTDKMIFNPNFRQKVSHEQSGVHIPLETFDGYPEILNGLKWTSDLDEVFRENQKLDPSLRWQYFGSFFGFMRVYPAFRWPDHPSLPDLFDVRRRSWYVQGSVTPKDVIILIDRSGSVHGPTLDIMKITARALLNSLGEDDFVNVAWFNNKVKWVIPCLNTLVQATAQVRRLLGDAVERLTESNLTSYATALDFAFEAFRKFDENKKPWSGSNCHKIIMFLSDGGTEWPSDLVTKHCNESRNGRIKIFTFACGPHPIPTVVLKEMACATGGYFSPITALGSVRVKIQDYVKVLSRPLVYSEDADMYHWHNFYRDVGGLGMVTTLTLPVFNKSSKATNTSHLLGVMGVDISVDEMTQLFPRNQLGSFGYPFAINTNGFVLFHPRLHDHIVYIEEPPNIYLTDLEGAAEDIEEMEKAMIDGLFGSLKNFKSAVPVGLGHAILVDMDYYYGSIEPSNFRFGIALPSDQRTMKINILDLNMHISHLSSLKNTILAPWRFCNIDKPQEELTVQELATIILNNYSYCDENLVNPLLWEAGKISTIQNHWNQSNLPGVWSRFIITISGLTTVQFSDLADDYQRQGDPLKNNLFKRASRTFGFTFSVTKGSWRLATVAGKIMLKDSFVTSVIGAEIEQDMIQEIFDEVTGSGNDVNCNSSEFLHCYLLNDGGIIVASNVKASKVGNFIGLHDPQLLQHLISEDIFKLEYRYNYQSWCSKDTQPVQTMSASRQFSILNLVYEAIISFNWNFIYSTFLYFITSVSGWKKIENTETLLDSGNHSCVTRSVWYYHSGVPSRTSKSSCDTNGRSFQASFLSNVTLIFVTAEPPCDDSLFYRPISLEPEEDVEPNHCSRQEHYRLRPKKCYSQTPKDIFSDCGATSSSRTIPQATALVAESFLFLLQFSTVIRSNIVIY